MKKKRCIIGFIAIAIAMFIGTLDSTIINIALPDIMNYFKASLNDTSWISTIYVLGLSVFMITASKLADQFGRKKMMIIGLILFGVSSAMCGLSKSLLFLIVMRFIQGIGGAIITPIVIPMAIEIFGKEKTRTAASLIGAITALAAAGGPPIGGLLIKYINWQSIFFVNVPFVIISVILILLFVSESYDKTVSKSIDWAGMILLTITLFLLVFALLKGKDYGWGSAMIISMFTGSVVSLILFIVTETKVKAPLMELGLFREYTFTTSSICYLITGFGIVSPLLIFNCFLQNALGYEALNAGFIIMSVSLTVIVAMPLGTFIASKIDARPVNFLGALLMAVGVLLLSQLKLSTSKLTMIGYLVVFGFGLGFSCQSLVSSIKYLPKEKTGIGSGIVNASRQIGTCIGIALLVSVLNTNVENSKNNIKDNAISYIHNANIETSVKKNMLKDINESFSSSDSDSDNKNNEKKMEKDIKNSLASVKNVPSPKQGNNLAKLYDGVSTLHSGAGKALEGQNTLNTGIDTFSSGISTLNEGSNTLVSGTNALDNGLLKARLGVQRLSSEGSKGIDILSSGIGMLNNGAQGMLAQFYSGSNPNSPTIYDGVTKVEKGTQSLSSNVSSYTSAVDNTMFVMIKNDPNSINMLASFKNSLSKMQNAYSKAVTDTEKEKYRQQLQILSNIVTLYTVGTDSSVTTDQQFEAKLNSLSNQSTANQNIVSSGSRLAYGANQLSSASDILAAQFEDGGKFKDGMKQIADGMNTLEERKGDLSSLKEGIDSLNNAISQLKDGSAKLINGSQRIQGGINFAQNNSSQLQSGSKELVNANEKLKDGASKISYNVGMLGQLNEIQNAVNKIKSDKDEKIAGAFDKTFMLSAIILMAASVCGLFTDRKSNSSQKNC